MAIEHDIAVASSTDRLMALSQPAIASGATIPPLPARRLSLMVIVPTRNEAGNVAALVERLQGGLEQLRDDGVGCEIFFVDDSDDETPAAVDAVRSAWADSDGEIWCVHRPSTLRWGGLGGAVVDGLRVTGADWVCVIDGDLQHPPELVPSLLARARSRADGAEVDLVVASRYCEEGSSQGLDLARTAISRLMTNVARLSFPGRLAGVTDPMSGFFLVRRKAIRVDDLRPDGFKILLEVLVRTPGLRVAEVPFTFGDRHAGESKASLSVAAQYFRHVITLRFPRTAAYISISSPVSGSNGRMSSGPRLRTLLTAVLTGWKVTMSFAAGTSKACRAWRSSGSVPSVESSQRSQADSGRITGIRS
jgi:dolichol-phosphate mannosyltransferase